MRRDAEGVRGTFSPDFLAGEVGIRIIDPDGWRNHGIPWGEPITRYEFLNLAAQSTIEVHDYAKFAAAFKAPLAWKEQPDVVEESHTEPDEDTE